MANENDNVEVKEDVIVEEDNLNKDNQNNNNDNDNEPKEKFVETPEAKRARLKRQLEQLDKKHPELAKEDSPKTKKTNELDYGQKAFLVSNGIKGKEEISLVQEIMASTGKTLEDILESKYFQSELSELRENLNSKNAVITDTKRSNQSQSDTVEYWINKGELPPESERELRLKVVNARLKKDSSGSVFTSNPVVK